MTLSNKSQSQEEHKSPATQVMFAANANIPPLPTAAEGPPKKGRKFDFKIIPPEVTTSIVPEEESNMR